MDLVDLIVLVLLSGIWMLLKLILGRVKFDMINSGCVYTFIYYTNLLGLRISIFPMVKWHLYGNKGLLGHGHSVISTVYNVHVKLVGTNKIQDHIGQSKRVWSTEWVDNW